MENKFTPGPWFFDEKAIAVYADGKCIVTCWHARKTDETQLEGESWLDMRRRTDQQREIDQKLEPLANAKLIAAAPELLEALKMILALLDENEGSASWYLRKHYDQINNAIKKATE